MKKTNEKLRCKLGLHKYKPTGKTFIPYTVSYAYLQYECMDCKQRVWRKVTSR